MIDPSTRDAASPGLPQTSPFLLRGFNWYVPRYLRRHFNAVRIAKQTVPHPPETAPLICFANHPGWWDPLLAFFLHEKFLSGRRLYAPIDNQALSQYPVFKRLGFYGIEMESIDGAKQFLANTRAILGRPLTAIWMTPGGRFSDVRERTSFQPGLSHIASVVSHATLIPIAIEYSFWEERTPEALIEFGPQIRTGQHDWTKTEWQSCLEDQLAAVQASLADKVISRDYENFDVALEGAAGIGGGYDMFRRLKSLLSLRSFNPRHRRKNRAEADR